MSKCHFLCMRKGNATSPLAHPERWTTVIDVIRNAIGTVAALAAALLLTGGAQEAFRRLMPGLSDLLVVGLDVGTYVGFLAYAATFFLVGLFLRGWLRSRFPLIWLLLPVVGLWLLVHADIWFALRCHSAYSATCIMSYSLLIVPLVAGVSGFRLRPHSTSRIGQTDVSSAYNGRGSDKVP